MRNAQSQNRVQLAVSDVAPAQAFAVSGGTANPLAAPGTPGYGLGNPALTFVGGAETHLPNGSYQFINQTQLNMPAGAVNPSYDPNAPRTGPQTYGVGPWNTAGVGNLTPTVVAQTATLYAANPGTGLTHLNRTDVQWLLATGRLQNGAGFQVTTRDQGSGTRSVAAVNAGLDPTFSVGLNDRGNGVAADGATAQINIGSITVTGPGAIPGVTYTIPGITYSNKTSGGSELRPTVQNARMAVGTLGLPDFNSGSGGSLGGNNASRPLRSLAYRDDANDVQDNSDGSNFNNWSETNGNPVNLNAGHTQGDLPSGVFIQPNAQTITNGSYVAYQNEQYVAAKLPVAGLYVNATVFKGDNGSVLNSDGSGTGHNAYNYLNNITTAVANEPFPTSVSLANPADTLLATGYIVPQLMLVQKQMDGLNQSSVNPTYNSDYRNNVFLASQVVHNTFDTPDASTVTSGVGSTYGNIKGANAINITATPDGAGGNYLFGNFNQNGVRDLSALYTARAAKAALFASGHGVNMFAGDPNSSKIPGLPASLASMAGQDGTSGATKGDLIVLGDIEGAGQFTGRSLYYMATQTAMSDASGPGYANGQLTTASGPTFGDQVRNGILRKNTALDYLQANATPQQRVDARAIVYDSTGTQVLADNDPTGINAFNKFDINRDGAINRQDAQIVDAQLSRNFANMSDQLAQSCGPTSTPRARRSSIPRPSRSWIRLRLPIPAYRASRLTWSAPS